MTNIFTDEEAAILFEQDEPGTEPERITIQKQHFDEMKALMVEAAEDIKAECDVRYPEESRKAYPSYLRKYNRDMEICQNITNLLFRLGTYT